MFLFQLQVFFQKVCLFGKASVFGNLYLDIYFGKHASVWNFFRKWFFSKLVWRFLLFSFQIASRVIPELWNANFRRGSDQMLYENQKIYPKVRMKNTQFSMFSLNLDKASKYNQHNVFNPCYSIGSSYTSFIFLFLWTTWRRNRI